MIAGDKGVIRRTIVAHGWVSGRSLGCRGVAGMAPGLVAGALRELRERVAGWGLGALPGLLGF